VATAFFGIGAMRAGTTWLAEILLNHPDCGMSPVKELHFFDVRYGVKGAGPLRYLAGQLETQSGIASRLIKELKLSKRDRKSRPGIDRFLREEFHLSWNEPDGKDTIETLDTAAGHEQFEALRSGRIRKSLDAISAVVEVLSICDLSSYGAFLKRHSAGAKAFGEISPAYALLPDRAYAEMNSLFPGAKFIFVMRDPVDRLWSQVRYDNGKSTQRGAEAVKSAITFREALRDPQMVARSNYRRTIESLERVVPVNQIVYLFYENIMSCETGPNEIRRIESALGLYPVEFSPEVFRNAKNASPPGRLSCEDEADAMRLFAPIYEFVGDRFGSPAGWRI